MTKLKFDANILNIQTQSIQNVDLNVIKNMLNKEFEIIYNSTWVDLVALLPEIYLSLIILIGLLFVAKSCFIKDSNIVNKKKESIQIWNLILTGYIFLIIIYIFFCTLGWSWGYSLFNGYLVIDKYTTTFKIATVLTAYIILLNSEEYIKRNPRNLLEFPIIIALTTLFLLLLISSFNFITTFLCIVGFSINIYVLLLYDSSNHSSREAAVKYYYLSTFSTGLLISGIFYIYLLFHTTNFLQITYILDLWTLEKTIGNHNIILGIMLYFILFGFLFKLAAFPCHMWAPEVYEGSPNPITAFFILPIKIATLGIFIRILNYVFCDLYYIWSHILWISSISSIIWGCFGALVEKNFKKFIAYSSINQMGFLLIGITCGTFESIRATIIYLVIYIIMNIGIFTIYLNTYEINTNRTITFLTDFNYFSKNNWFYSISFVIILFSMAGIPPLAGFFGKYYIFLHAFEAKYYSLVIIGMLSSLVSSYYYLKIIKTMWFESQPDNIKLIFKTNLTITSKYIVYLVNIFLIQFILFNSFIIELLNKLTSTGLYVLTG